MEYALIGEKLGHSYSERIHGMLGDYGYRLCPLPPEGMRALLASRAFKGLNVTIPYKRDVLPYCDVLSGEVREIGSANTLVVENGVLTAHNTDLGGLLSLFLRAGVEVSGKKAVVLGGGGTALTAFAALRRLGAREIVKVSRSGPVDYAALYRDHADAGVLVNATPVGMYPDNLACPVELEKLPFLTGVIDVVYNPDRTRLVLEALERGIPAAGGLWMLVEQARLSAERFLQKDIPGARAEEIYRTLLAERLNLALIGMPGSGKTALGEALANRLGREFVDCDREIERAFGMPIPEVFASRGEGVFREVEAQVIRDAGKRTGLVIATGGGAPLRRENVFALKQNGAVLHVERPLDRLPSDGRPLSVDLRAMEEFRMPIYRACSDGNVDNSGALGDAVEAALRAFFGAVSGRAGGTA
ncbi:MAG: hypothetical protein GX592_12145 [Clostridiales bacterium]|nr:hypothetical protein [Clostridiales bacterium]